MATRLPPDVQAKVREWDQRYGIGYIPCITSAKDVHIKNWQNIDFSTIDFEANLQAGLYDQGIALVLGKTLTPSDAPYNYSFALDFDGWDAIEAWFGNWENVLSASQKTRVEWHGNMKKIHYMFLSKRPIQNKKIKIKQSQLEIRCENQLLFCSPFTHKDGIPYMPLGTDKIAILDEKPLLSLEAQIDTLSKGYMSDHDKQRYIAWLEDPNTILGEGQGRHPALVTLGISYYFRSSNGWFKLTDEERKEKLSEWHIQHCKPPKPEKELDKIWDWIVDHCKEKRNEEFKKIMASATASATVIKNEDYADELIKEYNLITLWDTDDIWRYDISVGIFVPNAEPIIKARIEEDLGHPYIDENGEERPGITTRGVNECLDHIRRRTYTSRDALNPYLEWVACNNCMINLERPGETWPFSPEFMCTTHIPVKYVKYNLPHSDCGNISDFFRLVECACPAIMKFFYEIMKPEDVDVLLDYMAYCLWREYKYNFWMLLNGAGQNGKSILLQLLERFFGKTNVSGETLDRLLHERFAAASLFGKMLNVDADVSADVIFDNTGIIKKLTGNDLHAAEEKYKKPFAFRNYAKLFFSCNKIPETEDLTDAFFRRLLIINFTQQFFGEKDDPNLIDKLCTEEEFSGLLYELLSRLPRVLKEGVRKVTNEVMAETYDKYTRGSNPVKYFVEKAITRVSEAKVKKADLYSHYEKFCSYYGLAPESEQSFSRKLKDDFGFIVRRGKIKGELFYCWIDVAPKHWQDEETRALDQLEEFSFSYETKEEMK